VGHIMGGWGVLWRSGVVGTAEINGEIVETSYSANVVC
jgi:hypothetical protein